MIQPKPTTRFVIEPSLLCSVKCKFCFVVTKELGVPRVITKTKIKKMSLVSLGEEIATVDLKTGKLMWTTVVDIIKNTADCFFKIKTKSQRIFYVTKEHPFYIVNKGWVEVKDLKIGDDLLYVRNKETYSFKQKFIMQTQNPMYLQKTVEKVLQNQDRKQMGRKTSLTKKKLYKEGKLIPSIIQLKEKNLSKYNEICKAHSDRMKINNPMFNEIIKNKGKETKIRNGNNKGFHWNKDAPGRKRLSDRMKANNPMFNEISKLKSIQKAKISPSNPEKWFINLIQEIKLPIEFTGNASFWLTSNGKHLNPDFRVNGEKKVIEIYESRFFGRKGDKWTKERKELYSNIGWECLCLDLKDRKKEKDKISLSVRNFISNGDEIISIQKFSLGDEYYTNRGNRIFDKPIQTINFTCFPYDNFLADNILVHNCYHLHRYDTWKDTVKSLEEVKKDIDSGIARGNDYMDVTGGCPMIYPHICEVIQYALSKNVKSCIITNGLSGEWATQNVLSAGIDDFLVSRHGLEESHDFITNNPGGYKKQLRFLKQISEKMRFRFNCVISKFNEKDILKIAVEMAQFNPRIVNFINTNPHHEWVNKEFETTQVIADLRIVEPILNDAIEYLESRKIGVNVRYYPMCCIAEKYRRCICSDLQVCFDEKEWDYQIMPKTYEAFRKWGIDTSNCNEEKGEPCCRCDLQWICGGANKHFHKAAKKCFGDILVPQKLSKDIDKNDFYFYRKDNVLTL